MRRSTGCWWIFSSKRISAHHARYVFCGRHLLLARQRRANVAGCDGAVEEIARIVARIRQEWPRARIILRADSGFSNDELMVLAAARIRA
jgi:hypothetical protein